jgi:hypothetical protein
MTVTSLTLNRPHRLSVGDLIRHADDSSLNPTARVSDLTLRVNGTVAYPTYTIVDLADEHGCPIDDVLCTVDLVKVG